MKTSYRIISTFDSECPAAIVLMDKEKGMVIERGIWNPEPDNKDDLYVCLYNPDQHHVHGPDTVEDMLDVYQLEEILTPSMYQEFQNALFDGNKPFTFELTESDFSMPPSIILNDEISYETMRQQEATKTKENNYDMEM